MLSVEPWGMKQQAPEVDINRIVGFSALGRAVGDETPSVLQSGGALARVSVLSVEPWGMKRSHVVCPSSTMKVSVLSVEPWGMKPALQRGHILFGIEFQCSRSSRGG